MIDKKSIILGILYLVFNLVTTNAFANSNNCESNIAIPDNVSNSRIIVIGENHGTVEMPEYLSQLGCYFVSSGKQVLIGLEIGASEQVRINSYLQSDGDSIDKSNLFDSRFWEHGRNFGVASHAIFMIIENCRQLRKQGYDISIFAYDGAESAWPVKLSKKESYWSGYREALMGLNIELRARLYPEHTLIIFTGDVHARRRPKSDKNHESMAYYLSERFKTHTITFSHPAGESWGCTGPIDNMNCGRLKTNKSKFANNPEFDTTIQLMKLTASPPALGQQ
ncbi:hypothetical protein [Undibacterium danionis]|uniref:Haem-binding uptake Tiki superfamily ChaN domain-containing protein n=1 Tax=Undibacterium danionis TaxID=1812100 RepID=A0ABV6IIV2_9BURK